jgi:hypothetical protein
VLGELGPPSFLTFGVFSIDDHRFGAMRSGGQLENRYYERCLEGSGG